MHRFAEKMKISAGSERLAFFTFFILLFVHVSACLLILLSQIEDQYVNTKWDDRYEDLNNFEMYVTAVYFIITTIATVGYGDI